ncbi:hypothetical protein DXF84_27650, partial [Escherichia coli]
MFYIYFFNHDIIFDKKIMLVWFSAISCFDARCHIHSYIGTAEACASFSVMVFVWADYLQSILKDGN